MIINLLAVRYVLNALGVEDYGIYNVIAGVITMLSCVSGVLATATQRYYSYSIGKNEVIRLRNIFSTSINIYLLLTCFIVIIGETIGLWFINTQLVIPAERLVAANWIYQFSIFAFILAIMQVPYSAAVIAHEDLGIFAIISIIECVLKFSCALILPIFLCDRLIVYGAAILLVSFLVFTLYAIIGYKKYAECHYHKPTERSLYKELISFSGWTLFGSLAGVGMMQGNTILVNIFFGPIVNAARAISLQINAGFNSFSNSFITSIRPPMIKAYAENNYSYLTKIFYISNKFIYYCLLLIGLPIIYEMDTILRLWLKSASTDTIIFSRLILIYSIIMALHNPITIIMQATGRVKQYFIPVESITLLCLPITYVLFKCGCPAYTTFYAMIVVAIIAHIIRLICLKTYFKPFSVVEYIRHFILPAVFITSVASICCYFTHMWIDNMLLRLFMVFLVSVIIITPLVFSVGLTSNEKHELKRLISSCRNIR